VLKGAKQEAAYERTIIDEIEQECIKLQQMTNGNFILRSIVRNKELFKKLKGKKQD